MPYSPAQLESDEFRLFSFYAATHASDVTIYFPVPHNCTITSLQAMYHTEGNADNSVVITLKRGSTALFAVTASAVDVLYEDRVVATSEDPDGYKGEVLNITTAEAGTTPTFGEMNIIVWAKYRME